MTNSDNTQRTALITQLMREGNDRPTACIIADARLAAAERNLDGDLADRPTECCAAELAAQGSTITCGCDACEAPASPLDVIARGITVTDNTGRRYSARVLLPGSPYGNSGIWGGVFYQEGRIGITIDGTPATYNADGIARLGERPFGGALAIDSGADWKLTEESTERFCKLAQLAITTLVGLS